ncbi:pseudouridine synthase [Alternaria rosae]|uniref:pseudouridine synthase n=1 Tax=Alternaria rosae TaxID=1187941 RepID=UPI001E8E88EA|nr:pseudouridine synthase [Alternaria rosae]KAH6857392.1 pseudouridine synthase [Alternaria rosae]
MSEPSDESTRPAKRARLDDNAAPSLSTTTTAVPQTAPIPSAPASIDTDLEREVRAGITEYVCPDNLGFTGVLKQRYTDFLVNEIGLDGKVLHLKSTDVEDKKKAGKENVEKANGAGEKKPESAVATEKADAVMQDAGVAGETTLAVPEPVKVEDGPKESENDGEEIIGKPPVAQEEPEEQLPEEDRNTLHSIFGEQTTDEIVKLVRQVRRKESRKAKDFKAVISSPITDKDKRTQAHQSLRRIFPNLLESAMEENQTIRIKATPPAERKKKKGKGGAKDRENQGGRRGGQDWEELGGEYLHFNLYKENKDTMEVVGFLGSKLNCGAKGFGFAGTKDRRACTVQRVCVKRQLAQRIQNFNKILFNAAVGDFEYRHNDLKLGDLMGNEFTITLRDCHFQSEEGLDFAQRRQLAHDVVSKAITDFSQKGFINYYGLQRFGSFAASTDAIGRKMLQDDLKGAVEDLLAYSDTALASALNPSDSTTLVSQDDRNRAHALHIWKEKGSGTEALDFLPRKFTAERNIIQHLSSRNSKSGRYDRKTDWQGALMTIPRTLRLMYVHAYQSLVWNSVAGKRWATHGDKVVAGDLVLVNEHRDKEEGSTATMPKATHDQDGEPIINPSGDDSSLAPEADFERARPLTADEAASGKYSIWDVVLPQPGFDVEYPANEIGEYYKTFMGSEKGGGLDPYNMRRSWREVSLSGGYRKFLARPLRPLEFEVHEYKKVDEQFVQTDLQRLGRERDVGKKDGGKEDEKKEDEADAQMEDGEEKEDVAEEEEKIAVVIKLQLASSQYATMALRELMKAGGVKAFKPEFMGGR